MSLIVISCKRHDAFHRLSHDNAQNKFVHTQIVDVGLFFSSLSCFVSSYPLLLFVLLNCTPLICHRPLFLLPPASPGLLFADIFL